MFAPQKRKSSFVGFTQHFYMLMREKSSFSLNCAAKLIGYFEIYNNFAEKFTKTKGF